MINCLLLYPELLGLTSFIRVRVGVGVGSVSTVTSTRRTKVSKGRRAVAAATMALTAAAMGWEGVEDRLARMVTEVNLDQAPERRRVRDAFKIIQLGIDHCLFKVFTLFILDCLCYGIKEKVTSEFLHHNCSASE